MAAHELRQLGALQAELGDDGRHRRRGCTAAQAQGIIEPARLAVHFAGASGGAMSKSTPGPVANAFEIWRLYAILAKREWKAARELSPELARNVVESAALVLRRDSPGGRRSAFDTARASRTPNESSNSTCII